MPRTQQYSVDERAELNAMLFAGTYKTRELTRARCLLDSDDGFTDPTDELECFPEDPDQSIQIYRRLGPDSSFVSMY
jgi:hypothetical protein